MTDPVSGEAASQALEQATQQSEGVDEVEPTDTDADFSEAMADQHQPDHVDQPEQLEGVGQVDGPEQVDQIEEVAQVRTDDFVQDLLREESDIQQMMEECLNGAEMDQQEMLQMQAVIYSYSQRVELTTKVVESATGGIEQIMNTQV